MNHKDLNTLISINLMDSNRKEGLREVIDALAIANTKDTALSISRSMNENLNLFLEADHDDTEIIYVLVIIQYLCRYDGKSTMCTVEENLTLLGEAGMCESVLALTSRNSSITILEQVCRTVRYLVYNHDVNKERVSKCDGVAKLLSLLSAFDASADNCNPILIQECCMAIRNLIADNNKNKERFGELNGCEMIHDILRRQFDEETETSMGVIEDACGVLGHALCGHTSNQKRSIDANGCEIFTEILHKYLPTTSTTSPALIEECISCLSALSIYTPPTMQDVLGSDSYDLCGLLLDALTHYAKEPLLVETICVALTRMLTNHPINQQRVMQRNGCTLLVTVLKQYASTDRDKGSTEPAVIEAISNVMQLLLSSSCGNTQDLSNPCDCGYHISLF